MSGRDLAAVLDLLGYLSGASLYAMLFVMVIQDRRRQPGRLGVLPITTAILGLTWNLTGIVTDGLHDVGASGASVPLHVAGFAALGFLPAVVIHAALRTTEPLASRPVARAITLAAYAVSAVAAVMQVQAAMSAGVAPASTALRMLTFGFGAVLAALLIYTGRPVRGRQALWVVALAVFAVTALHWSHHHSGEGWHAVLLGHHASLPLVLAILYQDYRFALADSFLKRALALLALVVVAFALYWTVGAALLDAISIHARPSP